MLKIITLLITLLFLSQSTYAIDPKHYSSVEAMIKDQQVIRIGIDEAGGFGDIAASASIMKRLRQIGFTGTFEAVYPDYSETLVATLFNLPSSFLPKVYEDENNHISFIKLTEFENRYRKNANEQVMLGLSGWLYTYDVANAPTYANGFNTKVFAAINNDLGESAITRISTVNGKKQNINDSKTFFMMPIANYEQAKTYLTTAKGQELLAKKPALQAYLNGLEKQDFNVLPVYGFTVTYQYMQDSYLKSILEVITGARYAQRYTNTDWRDKPLIIAVFYDYDYEANEVNQLIHSNSWGKYECSTAKQARNVIKQLELEQKNVFSIASLADPKAIGKIKNLQKGQILLLSMGAFPKDVFDGIYTHTADNIWPQIREGLSSFSSLVLTGKPHFRCRSGEWGGWELGSDWIQDPVLKTKFDHFYHEFCAFHNTAMQEDDVWDNNSDVYKTLGEFITEAHDPNSALSQYFQRLKTEASKPENDRLNHTLERMMAIVNAANS